jgi:FkbM family methyltransferase
MRWLPPLWEQKHLATAFAMYDVDCVFDVGANYGQYATMLRRDVGYKGRIISFEPIPSAVDAIRSRARHDPLWQIEPIALSEQDGQQMFHIMDDSEMSSLANRRQDEVSLARAPAATGHDVIVRTETLATAFTRLQRQHGFARPYLKLDTQGYDVRIVQASADTMPNFIGLQSELAVRKIYDTSVDYREAIATYERLGFTLSALVPNNQGHFPLLVEIDCIMIRSDLISVITGHSGTRAPAAVLR